jgi:hypothetical protein
MRNLTDINTVNDFENYAGRVGNKSKRYFYIFAFSIVTIFFLFALAVTTEGFTDFTTNWFIYILLVASLFSFLKFMYSSRDTINLALEELTMNMKGVEKTKVNYELQNKKCVKGTWSEIIITNSYLLYLSKSEIEAGIISRDDISGIRLEDRWVEGGNRQGRHTTSKREYWLFITLESGRDIQLRVKKDSELLEFLESTLNIVLTQKLSY